MTRPRFPEDDAFRALRAGDYKAFAQQTARQTVVDYSDADFRGTDLRQFDLSKVVIKGSYLKDADLRGVDLRSMNLEGCSIHNAKIGGAFFPSNISAAEIQMSVLHGTRMRTEKPRD